MPLKTCNVDGKTGYQWGEQGKCYTGPDAKKNALKQGVAVEGPEKFAQYMKSKGEELSEGEIKAIVTLMHDEGYSIGEITATTLTLQKIRAPKDGKMGADGYYVHMKKNSDKSKKDSKKDAKGKTKKEWDKIDREELKRDTKKEKKEHEKDAVKDDKEKVKKLKKGDPSEKKKREVRDLKRDEKYDKRDSKGYSDRERHEHLDRDERRQDKRELDSDTLRQRVQHHKDAIKNLEREIRDLERDKREDERDVREER